MISPVISSWRRHGVDHRHPRRLVLFKAGVERIGDATGEQRHLLGVRHHRRRPAEHQPPLGRHHSAAITDDKELCRIGFQMLLGGIENPLVEGAGKALLGTEDDDDMSLRALRFAQLRI